MAASICRWPANILIHTSALEDLGTGTSRSMMLTKTVAEHAQTIYFEVLISVESRPASVLSVLWTVGVDLFA